MKPDCEKVKLGRRIVGGVYETSAGEAFMAWRWVSDIHRGMAKDISTAIRDDTAMWTIEDEIVGRMRKRGVKIIGVIVRETGERYAAPATLWFDRTKTSTLTLRGRAGTHRGLALSAFTRRLGKIMRLR